jgi:hypothetical protein
LLAVWSCTSAGSPPTDSATSGSDAAGSARDGGVDTEVAPPTLRFVAIGDTGSGVQGQLDVASAFEAKCKLSGCDFALLLGDNFYYSGIASVTDPLVKSRFEDVYRNIDIPFYVVLGNHDYGGGGTGFDKTQAHNEVLYSQVSTKWKMPSEYWHRVEKHVEFFGLDTTAQERGSSGAQATDVTSWIAASTATWKIALGHHPYRSNGPHGNAGTEASGVRDFFEANVCGKVDFYFCGHDHSRQWIAEPCGGSTELIVSGDGSWATELPGKNKVHFQASSLGFVYVTIEGKKITADFINKTGTVEFTRSVTKP